MQALRERTAGELSVATCTNLYVLRVHSLGMQYSKVLAGDTKISIRYPTTIPPMCIYLPN